MTALATPRSQVLKLAISSQSEADVHKQRTLSSFQSFKSTRKPDLDLISEAFTFAQESPLQYKIIDLIAIYRTILEMREELPSNRIATCDKFLDEVEKALNHFLDHKTLLIRKMTVSQIIG